MKYWVVFLDKGSGVPAAGRLLPQSVSSAEALRFVSARALERRAKVLPKEDLLDAADLPLSRTYLTAVEKLGGILVHESRWTNAASFLLPREIVPAVSRLPFVREVRPVGSARWRPVDAAPLSPMLEKSALFDYGTSQNQNVAIDVPALHSLGITGRGVRVGLLDSGFRWKDQDALRSRRVVGEYDFVFGDSVTANEPADAADQDFHGTLVFSVLGGYRPGKLIGPAFDAEFLLGKTEYLPSETRQEEDNWTAGIEWMENLGVDVVSSSLGYNTFDPPDSGYYWLHGELDGRTSITARAASRAARLGVVVCTAMGNEGNDDSGIGTMLTPADADSIISVGAVSFAHDLALFSSQGPTSDLRIKPDVVAPGIAVLGALVPGPDLYGVQNGTSVATPLVAGAAALLLCARPELTPLQVRSALRSTATPITHPTRFPTSPNSFTGWGEIDAFRAAQSFGPIFSQEPEVGAVNSRSVVSTIVISKFGVSRVTLRFAADSSTVFLSVPMARDSAMFYPSSGRYRAEIPTGVDRILTYGTRLHFVIDAEDSAGNTYSSPAAASATPSWTLRYGIPGLNGGTKTIPSGYALAQNFPNPFNGATNIVFDLPRAERVRVTVHDLLGRNVATLLDAFVEAGDATSRAPLLFDAGNLASGIYFVRMLTPAYSETKKIVLMR